MRKKYYRDRNTVRTSEGPTMWHRIHVSNCQYMDLKAEYIGTYSDYSAAIDFAQKRWFIGVVESCPYCCLTV